MVRFFEENVVIGKLNNAPEIHHSDPVADFADQSHVMGDKDVGKPVSFLQFVKKLEQP